MSRKITYKNYNFRLHKDTKLKLSKEKKKSGKSWNLFILSLLEKQYGHTSKR